MSTATNNASAKSNQALLLTILKNLNSVSDHIEASSVMSRDGLGVASVLNEGVDSDRLGAMCASLLSLGDTTAKELARGRVKQLILDGEDGYILIMHIGNKAVLSVVTKPNANLGMVFVEAKKTAKQILPLL